MRRTIATAVTAAIAVTSLTGTAHAARKPTIRQTAVWTYGVSDNGATIKGINVTVVRTDHKTPKGIWVCVQERNWHEPTKVKTNGCGHTDKWGSLLVRHHSVMYNGEQWRTYHPETKALAKHYGAWSYAQ